ncbi:hypothetical protein B0H12DRAFT_1161330 [Mycena haematopus]|nr:hypothetical protein B0H12DRAFT_1161330 [Mycena haematopus]
MPRRRFWIIPPASQRFRLASHRRPPLLVLVFVASFGFLISCVIGVFVSCRLVLVPHRIDLFTRHAHTASYDSTSAAAHTAHCVLRVLNRTSGAPRPSLSSSAKHSLHCAAPTFLFAFIHPSNQYILPCIHIFASPFFVRVHTAFKGHAPHDLSPHSPHACCLPPLASLYLHPYIHTIHLQYIRFPSFLQCTVYSLHRARPPGALFVLAGVSRVPSAPSRPPNPRPSLHHTASTLQNRTLIIYEIQYRIHNPIQSNPMRREYSTTEGNKRAREQRRILFSRNIRTKFNYYYCFATRRRLERIGPSSTGTLVRDFCPSYYRFVRKTTVRLQ